MQFDNFIRLSLVSVSYLILVFGLGSMMLSSYAKKQPFSDRVLIYFIAGNFYIMNIVFLLLFLRCTSRIITIIVFVGGAILIRYLLDKRGFQKSLLDKIEIFALLSQGVYGWSLFRREKVAKVNENLKSKVNFILRYHFIDTFFMIACFVIHAYYMGYRYVNYSTFGIYDESVHLEWIQYMLKGDIFYDGVYPFGFHNIIYAVIKIFGFKSFTVMRYFSFIVVMLLLLMLYLLLKKIYRSVYAPLLGVFLFVGANIFTDMAWDRLLFTLPQEFGYLFLYPMLIFLYNYICKKEKRDLLFFCISYAMTLYVHYYVTIIALLVCLAIGISGFYRMIKQKILGKLLLYGIISSLVGILPLGLGLVTGHELQGSLNWAMGVIRGETQEEDATQTSVTENQANETQTDTTVTENQGNTTQTETTVVEGQEKHTTTIWDKLIKKLFSTAQIIEEYSLLYVMNQIIFNLLVICMLLLLLKTVVHVIIRSKINETFLQFGIMLYTCFMLVFLCCKQLGLPVIMENYRLFDLVAYAVPLLIGIPMELLYEFFERWKWTKYAVNLCILAITGTVIFNIYYGDNARYLGRFTVLHSESSVNTYYKILKHYKDYSWTVVSTVDEYSMILDSGFHYEWIDLLYPMQNDPQNTLITIPSENIFFFIEKRPIEYGKLVRLNDGIVTFPKFTEADAEGMITDDYLGQPSNYYIFERNIIMAKAYNWAKQYMYYFPNEMTVFYEDDNFICFHLKQETYYLNNLAVNYE